MLLPVAKVTKLFGAERGGGVVVALYAEFPEDFAPESEPLFVRIDSLDVPLWCERFERRGAAGALAEFAEPPNWWGANSSSRPTRSVPTMSSIWRI